MIVGATSMYLGAAVAVGLFDAMEPAGVAWLRIAGAAVVLVLWVRPGPAAWHWRRLRLASAFGLMTAAMNIAFYEALDHLPLGSAVALEFLGPIAVAVAGSRTRRDLVALVFAVVG
ncbi:MAG: EamA family transporter, partial [Gordonia sp.]|nr:EamA family transporter [Gordonia sp. (in: high G+C Gram-positive bacteria)]